VWESQIDREMEGERERLSLNIYNMHVIAFAFDFS
jgi:hypothetical protein